MYNLNFYKYFFSFLYYIMKNIKYIYLVLP